MSATAEWVVLREQVRDLLLEADDHVSTNPDATFAEFCDLVTAGVQSLIAVKLSWDRDPVFNALYDLIVDHPMWIDDRGVELEYNPDREGLIGEFLDSAVVLVRDLGKASG